MNLTMNTEPFWAPAVNRHIWLTEVTLNFQVTIIKS